MNSDSLIIDQRDMKKQVSTMSISFTHQIKLNQLQNVILESQVLELSARLKPDVIFTNKDLINYKSFQLSHKVLQYEVINSPGDTSNSKQVPATYDIRTVESDIRRLHEQVESLKSQDEKLLKLTQSEKEDFPLLLQKYTTERSILQSKLKWARYEKLSPLGLLLSLIIISLPVLFVFSLFEILKFDNPDETANVIITYAIAGYFAGFFGVLLYLDHTKIREKWFDLPIYEFWSGLWDILLAKY
ncbi:hypothetical protein WICPIJ_002855 [Wickerhamomyces pijperi]|uniref:Uncharacterized protein n=1 Tax=Wickerhamomyces pijperi TaxID=599730 RepID=A0A9P8TPS5_WICPI|nr:hypothetical protein WICPIJ_002855 [Wickerhamomyces pijperi]